MLTAKQSIAQLYVAYFNRAPEPLGFDFWCSVLDNPVTLAEIATDFATQPEAQDMYPLLVDLTAESVSNFLTTVYDNLFDRLPDAEGLAFWIGVIQGGADLGTILLEIVNGASEADKLVVENKAIAAEYWVESARDAPGYTLNDEVIEVSREAIEAANPDTDTPANANAITDTYFRPADKAVLTPALESLSPSATFVSSQKVADITVADDAPAGLLFGLDGADASLFEIDGTGLFLKQGAALGIGDDDRLDVTVTVDNTGIGHFLTDGPETGTGFSIVLEEVEVAVEGDPSGYVAGAEFLVNEQTTRFQLNPEVAALGDGSFRIVWNSDADAMNINTSDDVKRRDFNVNGEALTPELTLGDRDMGIQLIPKIAVSEDGVSYIVWQSQSQDGIQTDGIDVKYQILDPDDTISPAEQFANTGRPQNQQVPDVATLGNGNVVFVWQNTVFAADGSGRAISARVVDEDGDTVLPEFTVNGSGVNTPFTTQDQINAAVTGLPDGGFAVVWETADAFTDGSGRAVVGKVFDADGDVIAPDFVVNEFTVNGQQDPDITTLANGNFVVTWFSFDGSLGDDDTTSIRARVFSAEGDDISGEFQVNQLGTDAQLNPDVTPLADGGFAIVWDSEDLQLDDDSGNAIRMRLFDEQGDPVTDEFEVNQLTDGFQGDAAIAELDSGELVVTWWSEALELGDDDQTAIHARIFTPDDNATQTTELLTTMLNDAADFTFDPAEMVGQPMPVEPDGGIV